MPTPEPKADPAANAVDDAVRLYLIDMALQHIMRQHGILGLGANVTRTALRAERDSIVARLIKLGDSPELAA